MPTVCILPTSEYKNIENFYGKAKPYYGKLEMIGEKGRKVQVEGYWKYDKSIFVVDVVNFVRYKIDMDAPKFVYLTGTCNGFRWSHRRGISNLVTKNDPAYLRLVQKTIQKENKVREKASTVTADTGTHICILRAGDYAVYKRDVESRKICTHEELSITLDDGAVKTIRGIKIVNVDWFITSTASVGSLDILKGKGMIIRGGALVGQYASQKDPLKLQIKASDYKVTKLFAPTEKNTTKKKETVSASKIKSDAKRPKKPLPKKGINLSAELPADSVVYLYSQKCHCSKCASLYGENTMVGCTATVQTIRGGIVPVSVMFCRGCGTFFMNYDTYSAYSRKYGGLKFQCRVDKSGLQLKSDIGFAKDSFLSRAGYSVNANMPRPRRQGILANLMDDGKATKWEITEKISEFIRLGKKNPNMQDAIKRWEEDIAFVADYDTDSQVKVGQASFKQGGKITRR